MSKGKILIVDDSKTKLEIFKELLAKNGYDVIVAENGIEGFQKTLAENPDIVIADLNMPKMNGCEMVRRIKTSEAGKYIPIICFTAADQDVNKAELVSEFGADEFVYFPFDPQELILKIETMMRVRKIYLELLEKNRQLEIIKKASIDRELKMIELKERIKDLEKGQTGSDRKNFTAKA